MNPYIEILRPGNALMSAVAIILVAIIDKTISMPVILTTRNTIKKLKI